MTKKATKPIRGKLINIKVKLTPIQYKYMQKLCMVYEETEEQFIKTSLIEMIGAGAEAEFVHEPEDIRKRIMGKLY